MLAYNVSPSGAYLGEIAPMASAKIAPLSRHETHGAMGRRIDPSWGGPIELYLVPASAQRLVSRRSWYVASYLWDDAYKRTLAANKKERPMWRQRVSSLVI